ncbi:MAG TPA: hypothetical protein VF911_05425 [Thermoanaerobaculia bacterium]|jgi:hypothetical protein
MSRALHLYTLSRMLAEPDHSFRVSEDLEVFDRSGALIEFVYVDAPGFLARARHRLKEHPRAVQRFISFDAVPRLFHAIPAAAGGLDGEARATLERADFSRKQIDALRDVFVAEEVQVEEGEGFARLSAWLGRERRRVSAADVRERVSVIASVAEKNDVEAARVLARVGVPSTLRIDVTPGDDEWIARVEDLRTIPHVRLRVVIDEREWRRAVDSGATLLWENVETELREATDAGEPQTWSEAAAMLRAMLDRDVERYREEHADLIADVLDATRAPELAWAVLDPAGLGLVNVEELFPELAKRRPPEAFAQSRAWLAAQTQDWREPHWRAVAEIAFWSKRWNLDTREPDVASFRRETLTPSIVDDGETVTAHWIAPLEIDIDLRRETIRRLDGVRRLYPERRMFGAHVYGNVSAAMAAEEFPSPWLYWVHLMFARPELTWDEYAAHVAALRARMTTLFARITGALTTWFRRDKPFTIFEAGVDAAEWDAISAALRTLPKLPKNADTPDVHGPYERALNAYAAAVHEFLAHSWRFFVANPQVGRGTPEGREKVEKWLAEENITREVPTQRLAQAVKALKTLQREYRARFPAAAASLDEEERERLWELWAVWWDFAFYPRRKIANAIKESKAAIDARLDERRRALRRRFRDLTLAKVEIHAEHEGLWLTIDVERVPNVVNAFAEALAHVIDVLRPPAEQHAFDRYVLDLVWERVHLVPLVRGKSLERKHWSLDIATLPRPDENLNDHAWKFVQRTIDDATWDMLALDEWPSNVAPVARRFVPAVALWRDALDHLATLREIPEADPDVLVPHWREVAAIAAKHADEVQEVLTSMPRTFFSEGDDAVATLQDFVRGIRALVADAEPLAFDTIVEARTAVADTLVAAASAIGDVWTDSELP